MSDTNQQGDEKTKANASGSRRRNVFEEFGDSVERFTTRTIESIKETLDKSMNARNTVLTIRVNEEANHKLNMLVDAGIFKSRSESAAFLIEEGIKHQAGLFEKIKEKLKNIEKIKDELKDIISDEMSDSQERAD